jgi:MarR family transcriptional regulator, lower aerobic nicotinate degradation pathway regulator
MSETTKRPPTLLALPSYVAGHVWKGARAGIQAALAEHGLGTADHGVLVALGDFGALSQQEIAEALDADKSQVVRLIDQLEQRGLVTRAIDPRDRRRHRVELTPAGRRLLRRATAAAQRMEEEYFSALSAAERQTLTSLLQRALESQERPRRPARST